MAGSAVVKANGVGYLPLAAPSMDPVAYNTYRDEVTFFPATDRTVAGLCGLISAKTPTLEAPDSLLAILDEITYNNESFYDVVEWGNREALSVTYGGLLIDMPNGPVPKSEAEALESGARPFISRYAAETILDIQQARIRGRDRICYVLLQETESLRRELTLVNGVYTINLFENRGLGYSLIESYTPLRLGAVINEVPFVPLSDKPGCILPSKPLAEDVAQLNLDHYRCEGRITYIHYWQSMAILYVTGVDDEVVESNATVRVDEDNNPIDFVPRDNGFKVGGPEAWRLSDPQAKVAYAEFAGTGVASLERKLKNIEDRIAKVGAQILASDKVAAEAAETVAMRAAAQNSTLATTARTLSRAYTIALRWVVWWQGGDKAAELATKFSLNTDYSVDTIRNELLTNIRGLNQSGKMSDETMFYILQKAGVYPEALTYEEELKRREADSLKMDTLNAGLINDGEDDE